MKKKPMPANFRARKGNSFHEVGGNMHAQALIPSQGEAGAAAVAAATPEIPLAI